MIGWKEYIRNNKYLVGSYFWATYKSRHEHETSVNNDQDVSQKEEAAWLETLEAWVHQRSVVDITDRSWWTHICIFVMSRLPNMTKPRNGWNSCWQSVGESRTGPMNSGKFNQKKCRQFMRFIGSYKVTQRSVNPTSLHHEFTILKLQLLKKNKKTKSNCHIGNLHHISEDGRRWIPVTWLFIL